MGRTIEHQPPKPILKTQDNEVHKVCAYCRVSTDNDQKNSLEAQEYFFDSYFKQHKNWVNVGIFSDEGLSGTSLEKRDSFNRMIELARRGGVEIILTKEVSRFSRNVQHLLNIVEELRSKHIYVWFLSDDINTQSDNYRERLTQVATNAEQESLRTSRRVKWGHQERMREGVVFGRKEMYGYNIVRDDFGIQHFEIIEDEAEIIRNIFEWFAAGDGTHTIARRLEQQGKKTKRYKNGWTNTVILRILRNEKYVGDLAQGKSYTPDPLTHKKKYNRGESYMFYTKDHHPEAAIIDRDLWDRVQAIMEEKAPSDEQKAKHSNRYWTSGKIFCGICGGRYVSYQKKQKNTPYKAWVCFENHSRGQYKQVILDTGEVAHVGCNALRVNDRILKTALYDIITQIVKPQKQALINEMRGEFAKLNTPKDNSKKIAEIEKRINEIYDEIDELDSKLAKKVISEERYKRAADRQEKEMSDLRKALDALKSESSASFDTERYVNACIAELERIVDLEDDAINEGLFERITKKIVVYPLNTLEIHLSFMTMPIRLQYSTSGKGEFYKVEFKLLTQNEFAEIMATAPRNEIQDS